MRALAYLLVILSLFGIPAQAQSPATLAPVPRIQFLDNSGRPLAAGKVCTFASGTSTPLATYTDASGLFQATNPIILDSGGFSTIWLSSNTYKFVVKSAGTDSTCNTGTQQYVVDFITPPPFLSGNNTWTGNETHSGTETFNGAIVFNSGGALSGAFSGNPVFTGVPAFNGAVPFSVASTSVVANLNASFLNGATFAAPGPIGSTTPGTGAFTTISGTTISATGQFLSTLATGTAPFSVVSTTLVPNLNVGNINGVAYPATAPAHSVPVVTTANAAVTYKVVPTCAGSITYNQSTDAFGCSTTAIQTASVSGCTAALAALCTNTVTWPVAFADTSYKAVCSGVHISVGTPYIQSVLNYTTTTIDVNTFADSNTGSAQFGTINCIGIHP